MKSLFRLMIVGLGLLPGSVRAQTPKLDSLERLIRQAKTDTGRINRMNQKITLLGEINLDSAIRLSRQTIRNAQRIRYGAGEATARVGLGRNLSFKGNYREAKRNLLQAEQIWLALHDSVPLSKVYNIYGMLFGMQSKYDSSLLYFQKSRRLAERFNNQQQLHSIYCNIGIGYQMLSNYPLALQYLQKALTLAETYKDLSSQAYYLINLANVYHQVDDRKGAEQRYNQALQLAQRDNLKTIELYVYTNLAAMYGETHTTRLMYTYAMKAAALAKEIGDPGIEATSLSRAATSLAEQKRFAEAEALGRQAISIADASQQPLNIHQTYAAMGMIFQEQQKYAEAIPYYEKSFRVLQDADIYDEQTGQAYAGLAICYEKAGQYRQSLVAYKTATQIRDSVRSKDNVRKTTELRMKTAFEKQQQTTQTEQQKKNTLAKARQLTLLVVMGLLVLLTVVAFYAYRTKQLANYQLQEQTNALQQTLTQLQTTQAQLIHQEKMASLGELTAGIAHEIQNPLNFVNNFSEVSTELIDELRQEVAAGQTQEALDIANDLTLNLKKIQHHGQRAALIVKGMLAHSRSGTGQKQATSLNTLTEEYLKLAYQGARTKNKSLQAELVTDFDPTLGKIEIVPQEMGRVLLNLFNNAFYAVEKKEMQLSRVAAGEVEADPYQPTVWVRTQRLGNQVVVEVRDNGTGIPEAVQQKIFQPFFTTKPTGEGTGLGLSLSYDIVTKGHGGQMNVSSELGQFTTIRVQLPA